MNFNKRFIFIVIFIFFSIQRIAVCDETDLFLPQFSKAYFYSSQFMSHEIAQKIIETFQQLETWQDIYSRSSNDKKKVIKKDESQYYADLAYCFSAIELNPVALFFYQKAHELNPSDNQILLDYAIELYIDGDTESGNSILLKLTKNPEKKILASRNLALNYFLDGKYNDSMQLSEFVISETPKTEAAGYSALTYLICKAFLFKDSNKKIPFKDKIDYQTWPGPLVAYLENQINKETFLDILRSSPPNEIRARLCEALFYVGEIYNAKGNKLVAKEYFKQVIALNIPAYREYFYSQMELTRLK